MSDETTQEAPKELREALDRAKAEAAEAAAQAQAATQELRQFKATTLFGNEAHAELFLKANPEADVTQDAVAQFRETYGLGVTTEAPPADTAPKTEPGLAAMGAAAGSPIGGSAPAETAQIGWDEFQGLLESNPTEAAKLYAEGRVKPNSLNVQAREARQKGIIG